MQILAHSYESSCLLPRLPYVSFACVVSIVYSRENYVAEFCESRPTGLTKISRVWLERNVRTSDRILVTARASTYKVKIVAKQQPKSSWHFSFRSRKSISKLLHVLGVLPNTHFQEVASSFVTMPRILPSNFEKFRENIICRNCRLKWTQESIEFQVNDGNSHKTLNDTLDWKKKIF